MSDDDSHRIAGLDDVFERCAADGVAQSLSDGFLFIASLDAVQVIRVCFIGETVCVHPSQRGRKSLHHKKYPS